MPQITFRGEVAPRRVVVRVVAAAAAVGLLAGVGIGWATDAHAGPALCVAAETAPR